MPGDVEFLEAARQARTPERHRAAHASAAAGYVCRAEEAINLLRTLRDPDERTAVYRIVEAWLALAEAELVKPPSDS